MSAENAPTPTPEPVKPTPHTNRYTLNAENISRFTPKSREDEEAALAVEPEPGLPAQWHHYMHVARLATPAPSAQGWRARPGQRFGPRMLPLAAP